MIIESNHFGNIEVPEQEVISFPQGLYAFEDKKRFVILGKTGEQNPFMWLHAVDDPAICFVVIDPFSIKEDYSPVIGQDAMDALQTEDFADLRFLSIVVVPQDVKHMTANLKSPVVINAVKNIAVQIIMDSDDYGFKHYILDEVQSSA